MPRPPSLALVSVFALALVGCGRSAPPPEVADEASVTPGGEVASSADSIEWREWGAEAFAEAREQDRLILVDVGIEGCVACRWMYEDTYQDARVIERIRENFVAIQVDADVRPDIGERYLAWAWPALIFLDADGRQVHAVRGNKRPRNFVPILDELLARRSAGTLGAEAPLVVTPLADDRELAPVCVEALARLDARQVEAGGWGGAYLDGRPLLHGLRRSASFGEPSREAHLLASLEQQAGLIDPVWGGLFLGAYGRNRENVVPEKRAMQTAWALQAFAHALHRTGDERWLTHAGNVDRYLRGMLMADDGTFFSSQHSPITPSGMNGSAYYRLDDAGRRAVGVPPIDHGSFTDQNGQLVEAYARLYEATQDDGWLSVARRTADRVLATRRAEAGYLTQAVRSETVDGDARHRSFDEHRGLFLRPQARFGLGALALYGVTGDAAYLDAARGIADALTALEDERHGGFFSAPAAASPGLAPRKPLEENIAAARFLLRLAAYTHDDDARARAERTLRSVLTPEARRRSGPMTEGTMALEELLVGPVEISVVTTDPTDARAQALFAAGLRVYEPRKALHFEAPGRYPTYEQPTVHVCTWEACSPPIQDPAEIAAVVAEMSPVSPDAGCGS